MVVQIWKKQFTKEKLFMQHSQPHIFLTSQWQRNDEPNLFYLLYRWSMTIFFMATWLLSVIDPRHIDEEAHFRIKWLIYLTNWGYTLCTFQSLLCTVLLTSWFITHNKKGTSTKKIWITGSYKIYWVSNIIATDIAFGITVLYWALIYDPNSMPLDALNIFVHGTNAVAMLIELCAVAHPMRLLHVYWPVLFGALYIIFSAIYYGAGGTSRNDNPYIYPVLDWRKPGRTVAICVGVLFFIMALHGFSCCVYWLRRYAHKVLRERSKENANISVIKRDYQSGFDNVAMANDIV